LSRKCPWNLRLIAVFKIAHHRTPSPELDRYYVRFEVLMAASMKMAVFSVIAPCSLVEVYRFSKVLAASIAEDSHMQMDIVGIHTTYLFKIYFNIILLTAFLQRPAEKTIFICE
jgi:hypothetical protein